MDFVTVIDQVIALLRQRGRVTYRTLQLRFALADTQLVALAACASVRVLGSVCGVGGKGRL